MYINGNDNSMMNKTHPALALVLIITPAAMANTLTMLGLANINVSARWSGPGTTPSSSITVTDSVRFLEQ